MGYMCVMKPSLIAEKARTVAFLAKIRILAAKKVKNRRLFYFK